MDWVGLGLELQFRCPAEGRARIGIGCIIPSPGERVRVRGNVFNRFYKNGA